MCSTRSAFFTTAKDHKYGLELSLFTELQFYPLHKSHQQAFMYSGAAANISLGGGWAAALLYEEGFLRWLKFDSDGEISWSPSTWALQDIRGDSRDTIQVEMVSTDAKDMVEVRYILSLREETLSSELTVSNLKSSSIQMRGGIISHLTVSTPEATFAYGLEGSDFCNRPVFLSNFGIVPPGLGQNRGFGSGQMWENLGLKGFFHRLGCKKSEER
ncbi:hypothetical protein OIU85_003619 [Salix viminalis]|uniref:Uncharacterized protein n=1 Tax=Salix viminalis TaxID=40686 RepID=A0A9Q0PZH7_SALVM|nr:hypothetical protein OIU85_003619 [Salix viminalis]